MDLPLLDIYRQATAGAAMRPPQPRIPPTRALRDRIREAADRRVAAQRPVPPLTLDQLREHARAALAAAETSEAFLDFATIVTNNALWRERLAATPFNRRLLLLPKCVRPSATCRAKFDQVGLLCERCGGCCLAELQEEAERLGYAVLVAEGSAVVLALLQGRPIDAIVGVSCLSVLERSFPYMEAAAIPGAAIPLLHDDCKDTSADLDWIWETLYLSSGDTHRQFDLDAARREAAGWFQPAALDRLLGPADDPAGRTARQWLARDGKRWRPLLTACAYRALSGAAVDAPLPEGLVQIAVAVECFHKASLVHDDIEDDDAARYGQPTLHVEHGVPIALNVGDLLLGEGYRLIAQCGAAAERIVAMTQIAAAGHRTLCRGQGAELAWLHARPRPPLAPEAVLSIFAEKTAPAFEVALRLGAAYAGAEDAVHRVLREYSTLLGVAYQARDDLDDWSAGGDPADSLAGRPSLVLAVAIERAVGAERAALLRFAAAAEDAPTAAETAAIVARLEVDAQCRQLVHTYRHRAIRALAGLENESLKGLLRRVIGKIFHEFTCDDWRCEPAAGNVHGGAAGDGRAG